MEIELLPAVSLLPIVSVLIAPEEMLRALNGNPHLQQFRILFITGIRFRHPSIGWTANSSWSWK